MAEIQALLAGLPSGKTEIRALFDNTPGMVSPEEIEILPIVDPRHYTVTFLVPVEFGFGPGGYVRGGEPDQMNKTFWWPCDDKGPEFDCTPQLAKIARLGRVRLLAHDFTR
jgi:hypothetical protein